MECGILVPRHGLYQHFRNFLAFKMREVFTVIQKPRVAHDTSFQIYCILLDISPR